MDYAGAIERDPAGAEVYFCRGVALPTLAIPTGAGGEVVLEGHAHQPDPLRSRELFDRALADFKRADELLPSHARERAELDAAIREIRAELGS